MKKLLLKSIISVSFLCLLLSLLQPPFVNAQLSGCAKIPVGNPIPANQQIPSGCSSSGGAVSGSCGSVVDWDNKIAAKLAVGGNGLYSVLTTPFTSTCASSTPQSSWS